MQITRQADYALRAILHLTRASQGKRISTSQIAKAQCIPSSFLAKIISQLSIAGLLHTSRGARGGIALARDPSQITMLEVIEAIDGPVQLNVCVDRVGLCALEENCAMQLVWREAQDALTTQLRSATFAQFI
ncbi:MAG: Rrf2 family transcriptional regulator [Anaerolineales bacterium]|nr:Rrf2 family transcriptional regulator [Anaerolineales bacterium]